MADFERYLASRYAKDSIGKEVLEYLIRDRVLEQEAQRRAIVVSQEEVRAAVARKEAELRETTKHTLDEELASAGITRALFEALYRKQVACERMVRADLGLPDAEPLRAEQQELWLAERVKGAKVEREGLPAGVVAVVDGVPISDQELGATLRLKLGRTEARDSLRQLAGLRLVDGRAKELGIEIAPADLEAAIERRRERFGTNPKTAGIPFEQLLQARGLTLEDLRRDAGVRGEALLFKIGELAYPDAEVDRRYEAAKERFDASYGEARRVSWILLHAGPERNAILKHTYDDADVELRALAPRATSAAEFGRLATIYSTDTVTKRRNGELGWVHRLEPGVDPSVLATAFAADCPVGKVVGPVRGAQGSALLWVHEARPAPPRPALRVAVRSELVGDFYRRLLEDAKIVTYLDPPAPASAPAPEKH